MHNLTRPQTIASWVLQLVVAGILLQTLFFKFTGAEESVYIFTSVGPTIACPGRRAVASSRSPTNIFPC